MLPFYIGLGAIISTVAAISAFLITYEEYLKHYPDKIRPFKIALRTAVAAFLFFAALTAVLALLI